MLMTEKMHTFSTKSEELEQVLIVRGIKILHLAYEFSILKGEYRLCKATKNCFLFPFHALVVGFRLLLAPLLLLPSKCLLRYFEPIVGVLLLACHNLLPWMQQTRWGTNVRVFQHLYQLKGSDASDSAGPYYFSRRSKERIITRNHNPSLRLNRGKYFQVYDSPSEDIHVFNKSFDTKEVVA